uniref:Lipoxygenase domain-containing protein n=1 Tax=Magallana gigas TaxID=29159 RepID=A0A8W8JEQ0_MAGGI
MLQRAQADHWFAWQRLNGVTRNLIKRVHEIPEQFVPSLYDIQENHPYLGGISLTSHAQNGTLYAVDLTDVAMDDETPKVPIALFTVWNEKLMPVAINTHTCHANGKVFTPSTVGTAESIRNWVNARIWFNMVLNSV